MRDTFAGKIISETRGAKTDSEKWSEFYRQKCRAGVRTRLLCLVTNGVRPQVYVSENQVRYTGLLKIVTWYGHLRDTFAGKILATFQKYFPLPENLKTFYRQKCRAT